ncbi:MAG: hypothetical protein IKE57_07615 [Oscillospiraceae bacterium]|nr:hypothetical protein [Oscillospiraceae bacterium]
MKITLSLRFMAFYHRREHRASDAAGAIRGERTFDMHKTILRVIPAVFGTRMRSGRADVGGNHKNRGVISCQAMQKKARA